MKEHIKYFIHVLVIVLLIVGAVSFRYWQVKITLAELTGKERMETISENIYNVAVYSHCCQVIEVIKERLLDKLFFSLPADKQRELVNEIMSEIKTERAINKTTE